MRLAGVAGLVALFAGTGWFSPGYDDEIFNITLIEHERSYAALLHFANNNDVHPSGQYLINHALHSLLGDWSAVRAATGAFAALTLGGLWLAASATAAPLNALFAYLVIALNPTLLLWCSGLRWYAYFVPVFNLLTLLILRNPGNPLRFWGAFFAAAVLLFWIGYAAMILVPAMFVVALYRRREGLRGEWKILAVTAALALAAAAPQLQIFWQVHWPHSASQLSGFPRALGGLVLHLLSGQAAFPASFAGSALILGNLLLAAFALRNRLILKFEPASAALGLAALGLLGTKLTGKFRNMVTLSALQGLVQLHWFSQIRSTGWRGAVLALFAFGNIAGIHNVVTHQDTTKGGWNTPYAEVLHDLQQRAAACPTLLIATHDPVVVYYARDFVQRIVWVGKPGWENDLRSFDGCRLAIQTFRGALNRQAHARYAELVRAEAGGIAMHFGPDRHAAFKRRFDADVPDWYVTIVPLRNTESRH